MLILSLSVIVWGLPITDTVGEDGGNGLVKVWNLYGEIAERQEYLCGGAVLFQTLMSEMHLSISRMSFAMRFCASSRSPDATSIILAVLRSLYFFFHSSMSPLSCAMVLSRSSTIS